MKEVGCGPGDREVSVEADDEQVHDGRVGRQVIDGQPRVAQWTTQRPFLLNQIN